MRTLIAVTFCTLLCAYMGGSSLPAAATSAPAEPPADCPAIAKAIAPSLVRVEITLKHDKGEPPRAAGMAVGNLVTDERPLEIGGFVISPTQVVTPDPIIHPRFIESVAVRVGDQLVPAKITAVAVRQTAVFLTTDKPLPAATPLKFEPAAPGASLLAVRYFRANGAWTVSVNPASERGYSSLENGRQFVTMPAPCLLVTAKGAPVAVSMREDQPTDDSWKGSPANWATVSWADLTGMLKGLDDKCSAGLLRVALSFRSPRKDNASSSSHRRSDDDESSTEQNVLGLLLDDKTVAVLANLKANVTSRLERIQVFSGSSPVPAKFSCSLKDYGAFLATLDKPLTSAIACSDRPMLDLPGQFALSAEVSLQGEKSVSYFNYARVANIEIGRKGKLYPQTANDSGKEFLFDAKGLLLALPVERRSTVASDEDRYHYGPSATPTPLAYIKTAVGDLANNTDKSNVPLSEAEESRLAWMGLVLQPLNRELARENNVSAQTQDGATGALVSYVYPDSPADKAGIKVGYILLRLRMKDVPKPVEVRVEISDAYGGRGFPWERLDELPEQYYDRLPPPWPSAEDFISRTLTDYGFGKTFTAEFFNDSQVVAKDFTVQQSPPHYATAAHYKSPELGVTVRDLTYELRRYFQKKPDDPGVIISNEEPGSKASVAGIKPYEIVTHIDGQAIMSVKDFQKLMKKQGEMRLSINRMLKGRQVKVVLAGADSQPSSQPASGPARRPASRPAASQEAGDTGE